MGEDGNGLSRVRASATLRRESDLKPLWLAFGMVIGGILLGTFLFVEYGDEFPRLIESLQIAPVPVTASSAAPSPPPAATSGPSREDVIACSTFRQNFVDSDWGLLEIDRAAAIAVGSASADEVYAASKDASASIEAAGAMFLSSDPIDMTEAINGMLLACSSVSG